MSSDLIERYNMAIRRVWCLSEDTQITDEWLSQKLYEEDSKATDAEFGTLLDGYPLRFAKPYTHVDEERSRRELWDS